MTSSGWRSALKRAPVLGALLRWTRLASSGGWIFTTTELRWFRSTELRTQLPLSLRAFGLYVRAWLVVLGTESRRTIPGAIQLFSLITLLRRRLGRPLVQSIRIDERVVAVKLDDPRFLAVVNEHVHPGVQIQTVLGLLKPGDTFVDIGANHGSFSIAAAHKVGSTGAVLAFEPQPELAALVRESLAHTPAGVTQTFRVALGDHRGETTLWVPRDSSGGASVERPVDPSAAEQPDPIRIDTLDHALANLTLSGALVVKMDVEGYETAVLRGATEVLRRHQPVIVSEFSPAHVAAAGFSIEALCEALDQAGYTRFLPLATEDGPRSLSGLHGLGHQDVLLLPAGHVGSMPEEASRHTARGE